MLLTPTKTPSKSPMTRRKRELDALEKKQISIIKNTIKILGDEKKSILCINWHRKDDKIKILRKILEGIKEGEIKDEKDLKDSITSEELGILNEGFTFNFSAFYRPCSTFEFFGPCRTSKMLQKLNNSFTWFNKEITHHNGDLDEGDEQQYLSDDDMEEYRSDAITDDLEEYMKSHTKDGQIENPKTPQKSLEKKCIESSLLPSDNIFSVKPFRYCNLEVHDFGVHSKFNLKNLVAHLIFINELEIIKEHPIKFIDNSPFLQSCPKYPKRTLPKYSENASYCQSKRDIESFKKKKEGIGITECGKYVILQQTSSSWLASCISMLILDNNKIPNYNAIEAPDNNIALKSSPERLDQVKQWINEAELKEKIIRLNNKNSTENELIQQLIRRLQKYGSGVIELHHPELFGHGVVLDALSIEENTVTLRDPFHGRMVTMKLNILLSWIPKNAYFIQIENINFQNN